MDYPLARFWKMRREYILYTVSANSVPSSVPARMSVGQWTKRNTRENAMSAARMSAGHACFLCRRKSITVAAKLEALCPEGNEKESGQGMSNGTSGNVWQGRRRQMRFFSPSSPVTNVSAMEMRTKIPVVRVFLKQSSTAARISQTELMGQENRRLSAITAQVPRKMHLLRNVFFILWSIFIINYYNSKRCQNNWKTRISRLFKCNNINI